MARFRFGWRKKINVGRVASKIVVTVLGLYVGGTLLDAVGNVLNKTESPFYSGLSLIGWTVGKYPTNGTHWATTCAGTTYGSATAVGNNCITNVSGSNAGILSIVGIVGIASIIMEFVNVKMI